MSVEHYSCEGDLVQWMNGPDHRTGRRLSGLPFGSSSYALIRESYTGKIVAVRHEALSIYPTSPIPEPAK